LSGIARQGRQSVGVGGGGCVVALSCGEITLVRGFEAVTT